METQARDVAAARAAVIPPGRGLNDLADAHRRWWGFYSQEQEKLDAGGHLAWEFMEGLFEGPLGLDTGDPYISIQQGFGRALLMPQIVENVGGGSTFDFVGDLRKAAHRCERTSGSASSPRFDFAQMAGPGEGKSSADEQQSRRETSTGQRNRTSSAMNVVAGAAENLRAILAKGLGMAEDSMVPIAGAKPTPPRRAGATWSTSTTGPRAP